MITTVGESLVNNEFNQLFDDLSISGDFKVEQGANVLRKLLEDVKALPANHSDEQVEDLVTEAILQIRQILQA